MEKISTKNNNIGIVADEGGDLPKELLEKYDVSLVPFRVEWGEMEKLSGNIYQRIREAEKQGLKSFIKTSQPSPGDFLKVFQEKLKKYEKIICVTVTSKHSGTFNSASQAKTYLKEKEKIEIIDSLNVSGGEGLIILKLARLIESGLNFFEIIPKIKESILKTNLIFILEDPKWAENSGRIPKILAILLKKMKNLGFYPILTIRKGKISLLKVKRKAKDLASALLEEFKNKISKEKKQTQIRVAITHADNTEEARKMENLLKKIKNCKIEFVNIISNIVGGLAGPGTVALSWQYD